ncbi:MAG: polyphosphate kinase 1 [Armatimonadetes bacterium]|nr:polyphosphate kinase 1 [Armatimonadota bacterium]
MPDLEAALSDPRLFVSRHLSWLAFNRRVYDQTTDETLPLLERVRLLAIASDNLDSFFMKRVGSLHHEVELGIPRTGPFVSPVDELAMVREEARRQADDLSRCLDEQLLPALAGKGIRLLAVDELDDVQADFVASYFGEQLFPVLTPLAFDPGRPFPFISNLSISLAVVLRHEDDPPLFARVKVPANRPRWIRLPGESSYVPLEQVIARHLSRLFWGMTVLSAEPFRITRSADVAPAAATADDLRDFAVSLLQERRFAPVVRLELSAGMDPEPAELLTTELGVSREDVYVQDGLLGLSDFAALAALDRPDLKHVPWQAVPHPRLPVNASQNPEAVFAAIREGDILLHHPFHDYRRTVVAFVEAAAADPCVLGIKQSVYRAAADSPTFDALLDAAGTGHEVTALVELQARFDEASNLAWAERLEKSGVHTSYGFSGLKTHTRMTVVTRQEGERVRAYVHFSTGDYNVATAAQYTDFGLLTARREVAADVLQFFNCLTGYGLAPEYHALVVAPENMRERLVDCLDREIAHASAGRPAAVVAMMNALVDQPLCEALCRASRAGVQVDLIVRGECCLRAGLPGISDNIRVRGVVGRFLEHARAFLFDNGGEEELYIGSADWMYRNLDHRIEAMLPVTDPAARAELREVLELYLRDTAGAYEMQPDGRWAKVQPADGEPPFSAQEALMRRALAQAGGPMNTSSSSTRTL